MKRKQTDRETTSHEMFQKECRRQIQGIDDRTHTYSFGYVSNNWNKFHGDTLRRKSSLERRKH